MARATKKEKSRADELWEELRRIQLTPQQKAELHAEAEKRAEEARKNGVYERLRELRGTVKWSISWEELRRDEE